jgi:hypothetical protein
MSNNTKDIFYDFLPNLSFFDFFVSISTLIIIYYIYLLKDVKIYIRIAFIFIFLSLLKYIYALFTKEDNYQISGNLVLLTLTLCEYYKRQLITIEQFIFILFGYSISLLIFRKSYTSDLINTILLTLGSATLLQNFNINQF